MAVKFFRNENSLLVIKNDFNVIFIKRTIDGMTKAINLSIPNIKNKYLDAQFAS